MSLPWVNLRGRKVKGRKRRKTMVKKRKTGKIQDR